MKKKTTAQIEKELMDKFDNLQERTGDRFKLLEAITELPEKEQTALLRILNEQIAKQAI